MLDKTQRLPSRTKRTVLPENCAPVSPKWTVRQVVFTPAPSL